MNITITDNDEILAKGDDANEWSTCLRVEMDQDGEATIEVAEVHSSERNSTPMVVWHRQWLRWDGDLGGSAVVDPDSLQRLATKLRPLLEIVAEGHTVEWDGSNHKGQLTDEAEEASDEIERIVMDWQWRSDVWSVWDASEWASAAWRDIVEQHNIRPGMTKDEIAAVAKALEVEAHGDNVVLQHTVGAIEWMIEKIEDEAEEG